jgi:hypothetical protein
MPGWQDLALLLLLRSAGITVSQSTVSMVMPAYNAERFVGPAIDSVLAQTYADFELLVIDDESTDSTPDIVEAYARKDSRVRIHRVPHGGAIRARNEGMALSTGEFIAVMDADDVCVPNRLQRQVGFMRRSPETGVLGSYVQLIDDRGRTGPIKSYPVDEALMAWSMVFCNCFAHPAVMIRRSALTLAKGYAPDCKGGAEDYDLFQRLNGLVRFATVREVLLLYRRWGGNMTQQSWNQQEEDATRIVQDGVRRLIGTTVPADVAGGLRGLVTGRYPRTTDQVVALRALMLNLYEAFINQAWLKPRGRNLVKRDLAIKLWLLAAVAARLSAGVSASTALHATRLRPLSVLEFAAKAASRVRITFPSGQTPSSARQPA